MADISTIVVGALDREFSNFRVQRNLHGLEFGQKA